MKKCIFFDVDGTIISEEGYRPQSAVDAIHAAQKAGNFCIVNSGRTNCNVDEPIRSIGFDGYIYGCGMEMEFQGKTIFKAPRSVENSRAIVELVRKTGMAVLYERSDGIYVDEKSRMLPGLADLLAVHKSKGMVFHQVPEENWATDKFVIWYDEQSDLESFQKGLIGKFDYIDRGNHFAEMVPCGYSKANAMGKMMELLGIDRKDTYAIGDSLNDRPMVEAAGTGIAMGEGVMLHPYADYITDTLVNDGLAKALEHFGLLR